MNDIAVKDDFFPPDLLFKIKEYLFNISKWHYPDNSKDFEGGVYWWTYLMGREDETLFQKDYLDHLIKKYFNKKNTKYTRTFFSMSNAKDKARPHHDVEQPSVYNLLIYLSGDSLINNGTGFYIHKDKENCKPPCPHQPACKEELLLHSHIGFRENRAIFFKSSIWHAPLQWAGESSTRYSLCNFLSKVEDV